MVKRNDDFTPRRGPPATRGSRPPIGDDRAEIGYPEDDFAGEGDVEDAEYVEGSAEARPMLFKWMKGILDGPDCESGFRATLCITSASARNGKDRSIRGVSYALDMDLNEFVDDLVDVADDVVRKHRREVKFAVRIPIGGRPAERKHFTLTVTHENFDENRNDFGKSDYGSDAEAIIAQAVDHTEVLMRETVGVTREGIQRLEREIARKDRLIERLEAKIDGYQEKIEDVRDMQWARDDARDERRHDREQKDWLFRGMMQGGKYLLASITGGGGLPLGMMAGAAGAAGMPGGAPPIGPAMFGSVGGASGGGAAHDPNGPSAGFHAPTHGCIDELHHAIVAIIGDFFEEATIEQMQGLVASNIFPPSQIENVTKLHKIHFALKDRAEEQARYAAASAHAQAQQRPPSNGHGPPNGFAPNGPNGEVQR